MIGKTTDQYDNRIYCAAKWHNMNNRGCQSTVIRTQNVTALKGLNI